MLNKSDDFSRKFNNTITSKKSLNNNITFNSQSMSPTQLNRSYDEELLKYILEDKNSEINIFDNYSVSQDNIDESRNLLLNMTNEEKLGIVEQRRKYLIERLDRLVKNKDYNNESNKGHIIEIDSKNDIIDLNFNDNESGSK